MSNESTYQPDASILKGTIDQSRENTEAVRDMIRKIFAEKGIKIELWGCGCCGSPNLSVEFEDGTKYETENFTITEDEDDDN